MSEAYKELGKLRWCRRRSLVRRQQPSGVLLRVRLRNRLTQQRSHFFLDVDDDMRLTQIFGQAGVLSAKFLDFFFHGVALPARVSVESEPRGFHGHVLSARRRAETRVNIRS